MPLQMPFNGELRNKAFIYTNKMTTKKSYKIIFAGTPQFSVSTLSALLDSEHTVIAVYTQPDRPAGRGRKLTASPVKELAVKHGIPVYQPQTLRDEAEQKRLTSLGADVMVVVAYGLLLPLPVLQAPRYGCINVHASLLPRWRGAAPIQRAILEGDQQTGVTIMQMDKGLDTGDMLAKVECPINIHDTSALLHDRLAASGAEVLIKTLAQLDDLTAEKQDNALATYAHKISKEEAEINWQMTAIELDRKIRAFDPWPVAFTDWGENTLRLWEACVSPETTQAPPGTIIQTSSQGIDVATGMGVLRLLKVQLPGGKPLSASDLLNARQQDFAVLKKLGKI